ncbi:MAG TPA: hypothetical protein PLO33_14330 [Kouleothrix sp.]|nr:hypothetical protein [Kouleothrix sp.]
MLRRFFPAALVALALVLSGCGGTPAASVPTAAPTAEPTAAPTAAPTAVPAASAAGPSDPVLEQAVRRKLSDVGMAIPYTIVVEQQSGDAARVQAIPNDFGVVDPAWLFVKRHDGVWTVVAGPGTAFPPEDLAAAGIPAGLALREDSNSAAAIERAVREKLKADGITFGYTVSVQAGVADFVRVQTIPTDPKTTDPAWVFLARKGDAWSVVAGPGTAFGPDDLAKVGVPAALLPGAAAACSELHDPLKDLLKVDVTQNEAAFGEMLSGKVLQGCQLTALGNGGNFSSFVDVSRQIGELLAKGGWKADEQYVADGPTGTVQGYRKGGDLAIVSADWQPAEGVSCPADQPIGDCKLTPAQQHYTIVVSVAPAA